MVSPQPVAKRFRFPRKAAVLLALAPSRFRVKAVASTSVHNWLLDRAGASGASARGAGLWASIRQMSMVLEAARNYCDDDLDRLATLDPSQLGELCEHVAAVEREWQPPQADDGGKTALYFPGLTGLAPFDPSASDLGAGPHLESVRAALTGALIYGDEISMLPGLAGPQADAWMMSTWYGYRAAAARGLALAAPLIDAGLIELVPDPDRARDEGGKRLSWADELDALAREQADKDAKKRDWTRWCKKQGLDARATAYEAAFDLAASAQFGARLAEPLIPQPFAPPGDTYRRIRRKALKQELAEEGIDLRVHRVLTAVDLPLFSALPADDIVAIRGDAAFEQWRELLRGVTRLIEGSSWGADFEKEARAALEDAVVKPAERVGEAVSRSTAMKAAAKEQTVTVLIGGAVTEGAVLTDLVPQASLAVPVGTAMARVIYAGVFPPRPKGLQSILARLG